MDHYTTLGVSRDADQNTIKQAYRKLAAKHHPDRGGDTASFQKIQEAYETLSNSEKKQQYDNPHMHGHHFNGFPGGGFSFHAQGFDINDIFGQMFGNQNPFQQRQQIFRTHIDISLEDSYNGGTQVLKIQTNMGVRVINIDIPKGIQSGEQIRYDNVIEGGQLIIEFRLSPHLRFERQHNDLISSQQINVLDLITGGNFEFRTISGKSFTVEIPPKTQPYMQLKIPNQGMPIRNSTGYGDQIILIKPYIPDNIHIDVIESIKKHR